MAKGRLYIGNIPYDCDDEQLRNFFAPDELSFVRICTDRDTGRPRGFGFVELTDPNQEAAVIARCHNKEMGGRTIVVNQAKDKPSGPREQRSDRDGDRGRGRGGKRGEYRD